MTKYMQNTAPNRFGLGSLNSSTTLSIPNLSIAGNRQPTNPLTLGSGRYSPLNASKNNIPNLSITAESVAKTTPKLSNSNKKKPISGIIDTVVNSPAATPNKLTPSSNLSEQELRGLAKQASYVNFSFHEGKIDLVASDENLTKEFKNKYSIQKFSMHYDVLDQMPNTSTGASALLLREKHSGKAIITIRGTEPSIKDYLTDIILPIDGRPIGQEIDIFNYYQELSTPKGAPVVEAQYAKKMTIGGGVISDTSKIVTSVNPNKKGKGLISKTEPIEIIGHSLGGTSANGLHYSIPNPSITYGANAAGLRLNEPNKKVYEQFLAISSGSKQNIDWEKKNKLVTNTVTTGFPSFTASNTPVLPQNGTVVKLPQSIDGVGGHFIAPLNDSRILSHIVKDIGSDYAELTSKYTTTTVSNRVNQNVKGLSDKTYKLNTKVNYEKMLLNNMAEFLDTPKRYEEGNEENNRQLLMEIREKVPQLDNNQKRKLNEYLNNPNNIKRQDSIGSSNSNGVNMRNHRQYENLIQAMSQTSKHSSSTSIQANNITNVESVLTVNTLV